MVAGLTLAVGVVATGGVVTVTETVPLDAAKLPDGENAAVMTLAPRARAEPFTERVAVLFAPEAEATTAAVPSVLPAAVNVTLPVGAAVPVTPATVAVNCVDTLAAKEEGLAVTVVVVPTAVEAAFHFAARLFASRDPSPVARS